MTDNIKHINVDSEEYEDAPLGLRQYAKQLQTALRSVTKERDDALGNVASYAVRDVLAGQNFKNPERVQKALLADGIDPLDSNAVNGWLSENGDDYAKGAPATASPEAQQEQQPAAVPDETVQAYQQVSSLQGEPATNDKWQRAQAEITPAMSGDEVLAVYAKYGI